MVEVKKYRVKKLEPGESIMTNYSQLLERYSGLEPLIISRAFSE